MQDSNSQKSFKNRPLVSVIIPVYNGEAYLAEAVESVLAQRYRPLEVIVVDDGSTDGSGAIAKGFAGAGVRYVYQANQGIGAARNTGTQMAGGSFLAFLDADDLWVPDKLTLQMEALGRDEGLDMVFGQVEEYYDSSTDAQARDRKERDGRVVSGYIAGTMVIRRSSFEQVGPFGTQWRLGEFIDWYAKATEKGLKSLMLPKVVTKRRIHDTNIGIRERRSQGDYLRVLKQALDRRRTQRLPDEPR